MAFSPEACAKYRNAIQQLKTFVAVASTLNNSREHVGGIGTDG
jgi:hypothetical protein